MLTLFQLLLIFDVAFIFQASIFLPGSQVLSSLTRFSETHKFTFELVPGSLFIIVLFAADQADKCQKFSSSNCS